MWRKLFPSQKKTHFSSEMCWNWNKLLAPNIISSILNRTVSFGSTLFLVMQHILKSISMIKQKFCSIPLSDNHHNQAIINSFSFLRWKFGPLLQFSQAFSKLWVYIGSLHRCSVGLKSELCPAQIQDAAQQPQKISKPHSCFTEGMVFFVLFLNASFVSSVNIELT